MGDVNKALDFYFNNEGGFEDRSDDLGGPTNFGVSLKEYIKDHPTATVVTIKNLTRDVAAIWTKGKFWSPMYERILDQDICSKIFDIAANMGPGDAGIITQTSINFRFKIPLRVDGVIGSKTVDAINQCNPIALMNEIQVRQIVHYIDEITRKPTQKVNLLGWLRRAVKP